MARQITVTESPCKLLPTGMSWLDDYRKRTGSPLGTDSYFVRSDAGGMRTQRDSFATLTEARRHARTIVRSGKGWAEIFRTAENFNACKDVWIASYEVETESGATVA